MDRLGTLTAKIAREQATWITLSSDIHWYSHGTVWLDVPQTAVWDTGKHQTVANTLFSLHSACPSMCDCILKSPGS